jgi:septal ring factor EnvC (AmiA/AmiB activator)
MDKLEEFIANMTEQVVASQDKLDRMDVHNANVTAQMNKLAKEKEQIVQECDNAKNKLIVS